MKRRSVAQAGFTMVELITVMVLLGVLAAIAIPRLMGDNTVEAAVHGDKVASAVRLAQKTALAKRRSVCLATGSGTLRVSAAPGSGACDLALRGVADNLFASKDPNVGISTAQPMLRFQPDGSILDADGKQLGKVTIAITLGGNIQRTIRLDGGTGYVD